MTIVRLQEPTYHLLQQRAAETARTPDDLADEVLRRELAPAHAHIEVVTMIG